MIPIIYAYPTAAHVAGTFSIKPEEGNETFIAASLIRDWVMLETLPEEELNPNDAELIGFMRELLELEEHEDSACSQEHPPEERFVESDKP